MADGGEIGAGNLDGINPPPRDSPEQIARTDTVEGPVEAPGRIPALDVARVFVSTEDELLRAWAPDRVSDRPQFVTITDHLDFEGLTPLEELSSRAFVQPLGNSQTVLYSVVGLDLAYEYPHTAYYLTGACTQPPKFVRLAEPMKPGQCLIKHHGEFLAVFDSRISNNTLPSNNTELSDEKRIVLALNNLYINGDVADVGGPADVWFTNITMEGPGNNDALYLWNASRTYLEDAVITSYSSQGVFRVFQNSTLSINGSEIYENAVGVRSGASAALLLAGAALRLEDVTIVDNQEPTVAQGTVAEFSDLGDTYVYSDSAIVGSTNAVSDQALPLSAAPSGRFINSTDPRYLDLKTEGSASSGF